MEVFDKKVCDFYFESVYWISIKYEVNNHRCISHEILECH